MPNVRDVQESGANLAWLALSPEVVGITAKYFNDKKEIPSSSASYSIEKQEDLWTWTVKASVGEVDGLAGLLRDST